MILARNDLNTAKSLWKSPFKEFVCLFYSREYYFCEQNLQKDIFLRRQVVKEIQCVLTCKLTDLVPFTPSGTKRLVFTNNRVGVVNRSAEQCDFVKIKSSESEEKYQCCFWLLRLHVRSSENCFVKTRLLESDCMQRAWELPLVLDNLVFTTVPPGTIDPLVRGQTSAPRSICAAKSPRWDEFLNLVLAECDRTPRQAWRGMPRWRNNSN